jgi:hypothetical protein
MSKLIGLFCPAETRGASDVNGLPTFRELTSAGKRHEVIVNAARIEMLRPCVILPILGKQLPGVIVDTIKGSMIVFGTVQGIAQLCGFEYLPSEPPTISLAEAN